MGSPLARGAVGLFIVSPGNRITARAGSRLMPRCQVCSRDHRCSRGEQHCLLGPLRPEPGSPRGAFSSRAGSRLLMTILQTWLGDHPLARGAAFDHLLARHRQGDHRLRGEQFQDATQIGGIEDHRLAAGSRSLEIRQTKQQQDSALARGAAQRMKVCDADKDHRSRGERLSFATLCMSAAGLDAVCAGAAYGVASCVPCRDHPLAGSRAMPG